MLTSRTARYTAVPIRTSSVGRTLVVGRAVRVPDKAPIANQTLVTISQTLL